MLTINGTKMKAAILSAALAIYENESYLSKLDSFVGDGDHGSTVARGFRAAEAKLNETTENKKPGEWLQDAGAALSKAMGGAIGPIFGGIFTTAGKNCSEEEINQEEYIKAMRCALDYIKKIGGAKEGDRTLVDAFSPYISSLERSLEAGEDFAAALKTAANEAEAGAENTKTMQAKKGRAKFLQDKSIGYRDAGASSFTIVVTVFAHEFSKEA